MKDKQSTTTTKHREWEGYDRDSDTDPVINQKICDIQYKQSLQTSQTHGTDQILETGIKQHLIRLDKNVKYTHFYFPGWLQIQQLVIIAWYYFKLSLKIT